jgi:hypothetical protein
MQAGGDVLGRCLTAKHVALEHLGQLISSYVGKVPVGGGSPQCLLEPLNAEPGHHPTYIFLPMAAPPRFWPSDDIILYVLPSGG